VDEEDRERLRWLSDRAEIGDLIRRYSYGTDLRDFEMLCSVFADDVVCDFGPVGIFEGLDQLQAFAKATIGDFPMTQHVTTNELIEIEGDRATVMFYGRNALLLPGNDGRLVRTGARYHQELVRTDKGWKVKKHTMVPLWNDDGGVEKSEMMTSLAARADQAAPRP